MNSNLPIEKLVDSIWNNQKYGDSIQQNLAVTDFLQENKLALFIIGKSYLYFLDMKDAELNNFSSGTMEVLGYEPNEMSLGKLISLVHPADLPIVISFESKVMEFFNGLPIEKMFKYKVRYDYRVKHKDGHYIRLLQQVITIEKDDKGAIVKTMGIHSDITDLKNEGLPVLSFLKPEERFTPREKEILNKLIQGKRLIRIEGICWQNVE